MPAKAPRLRSEPEPLLTPAEVATMFRVDPKTVTRWAKMGRLTSVRTLGGHRRYREAEVMQLLHGDNHDTPDAPEIAPGTTPRPPLDADHAAPPTRALWTSPE